jgi:hypothetical protein
MEWWHMQQARTYQIARITLFLNAKLKTNAAIFKACSAAIFEAIFRTFISA